MDFSDIFPLILTRWQILSGQRFQAPTARGVSSGVAVIMTSLVGNSFNSIDCNE